MLATVEIFLLGFVSVVDTVLLLIMLDRANRPEVPVWLTLTFVAVWLLHVGDFLHGLLADSSGTTALLLDDGCMIMMAGGLLMLPCSVLHGAIRLFRDGTVARPRIDLRLAWIYLPLLLLIPVTISLLQNQDRDFRVAVAPFTLPWTVWLIIANSSTAWFMWQASRKLNRPALSPFLRRFCTMLIAMSVMLIAYLFIPSNAPGESVIRMLMALSPVVPAIVFAWYAFRHRLLPIVFERTLVYGGCLIAVFWLHHVTIAPLTDALERKSRFDFVVLEIILFVALVLAWKPLRERVSESLRYLLSSSVTRVRDATRELSVQLSQKSSESPESVTQWLCESLQTSLGVESSRIVLYRGLSIDAAAPPESKNPLENIIPDLANALSTRAYLVADQLTTEHSALRDWMMQHQIRTVFRCLYRNIEGFVLLGPRVNSDWLSLEQRNTLSLLFDQFAAVLFNQQRELIRRASEREAMQKEKLSVLGLLAGSLAHEIRNPLSSMKTIATLLMEDLTHLPDQQKDVRIILSEIDRLTSTTHRLLESARPADDRREIAEPDIVIRRLLHILGHLARQYEVQIDTDLQAAGVCVASTEATLSEIFFNLIRNAIEAVQSSPDPRVSIRSSTIGNDVCVQVVDNGPGISPELQNSLFQPFITGKPQGTGLGLYIVSERVRELNGTIRCRTEAEVGCTFDVRLPGRRSADPQQSGSLDA